MYGKAKEILPMKVWKLPKSKEYMRKEICSNGKYLAQIKKDGYHYMFEKDEDGNCWMFSRKVSDVTGHLVEKSANVPHIIEALQVLPNGTILVGEIYYPGGVSKDVTKIMGCHPDKAVERQKEFGPLHYYVFDILQHQGELLLNTPLESRLTLLENVLTEYELLEHDFIEYALPIFDDLDNLIDEALNNGEEGVILKKIDGRYHPDKRPAWEWVKFKIEDEGDVICMGFEPPTKEYTGKELEDWGYWENLDGEIMLGLPISLTGKMLTGSQLVKTSWTPVTKPYALGWAGSIKMGVIKDGRLVEVGTVSSGLTDSNLQDIAKDPQSFIGKPFSVRYMQAFDGAVRHPVFAGWRDDINPQDCTWEKFFG